MKEGVSTLVDTPSARKVRQYRLTDPGNPVPSPGVTISAMDLRAQQLLALDFITQVSTSVDQTVHYFRRTIRACVRAARDEAEISGRDEVEARPTHDDDRGGSRTSWSGREVGLDAAAPDIDRKCPG
jgi:hypothetical protein